MKTHIFHISGTHCPSCKILIEGILIEQDGITKASVNLKQKTILIKCEDDEGAGNLLSTLSEKIESHGYQLSHDRIEDKKDGVIWQAIPLGLIILVLFFLLQKSGILNFGF